MTNLYQQLGAGVKGMLNGFDRIVFKGGFKHLMFESGVSHFLRKKGVLNKDYKGWALEQTKSIVDGAEQLSQSENQEFVRRFKGKGERKEKVARKSQSDRNISEGLIGICYVPQYLTA